MKMKKIWIHRAKSFKEAKEFEDKYYLLKTPSERLSDVQFCRDQYFKIKGSKDEDRKGLRRVIRIFKQK